MEVCMRSVPPLCRPTCRIYADETTYSASTEPSGAGTPDAAQQWYLKEGPLGSQQGRCHSI